MRRTAIVLGVAAVALAVGALLVLGGTGRDIAGDALGALRLGPDPPFRIVLSGPLWRDRSLHGGDGAQDFAQVATDEPLYAAIRGTGQSRVAEVELRVDGRRQRVVTPACPRGRCPVGLSIAFVPRLRGLKPGDHEVAVVARDARAGTTSDDSGPHVSAVGMEVRTVAGVPALAAGSPVGQLPAGPAAVENDAGLRRAALGVLAAERRTPRLAAALGSAPLRVLHVGALNTEGRGLGATILVELVSPRHDVKATVPAFIPRDPSSSPPYSLQDVRMQVTVLRDALIDLDLRRRRAIAFEPGPGSQGARWQPSREPAPTGAAGED